MNIRTRFAPSPTGFLHLGGARTALFSWAYAKKFNGKFILRVEDTDEVRSSKEAVNAILDGLSWLGLDFDEGPFFQSKRKERYKNVIQSFLGKGLAYLCYCSNEELNEMREIQKSNGEKPRYNGRWRPENVVEKKLVIPDNIPPVVRFKNPVNGLVSWDDCVLGKITIDNRELDDLIIARADGTPTYNFTVVVDDADMNISHVIRGDDHINNTPRQINILNALAAKTPKYAHLPMIHGSNGEKLSKRHGAVSILKYKEEGYLPQALVNHLARLGWGHGNSELFSISDFVDWFSLKGCSKSAAKFDFEKLKWVNANYMKRLSYDEICSEVKKRFLTRKVNIKDGPDLQSVCELMRDRMQTFEDLVDNCQIFFLPIEKIIRVSQVFKMEEYKKFSNISESLLKNVLNEFVKNFPSEEDEETFNNFLKMLLNQFDLKMPQLVIPIRLILLGRSQTPSIGKVLSVLGKKIVCLRILKAI